MLSACNETNLIQDAMRPVLDKVDKKLRTFRKFLIPKIFLNFVFSSSECKASFSDIQYQDFISRI